MANRFFTTKVFTTVSIVVFVMLLILLAVFAINALLLIFGAILFAVFLRGLADLLAEKTGLGKGLSLAIVGLSLIFISGGAIYLLAPSIADQVKELRHELPRSIDNLRGKLERYNWGQAILQQIPAPEEIANSGESGETIKQVGKIFASTISVFLKFVVFVLLSVYLAAEPQLYINGFLRLFSQRRRDRAREVLNAIGETLRWWLVGKFCSMIIIGILTTVGLWALGVPLYLTLGLFAAATSFIPNFGPIIAVVPAALVAFANNPLTALYVFPLYYFIQVIESYLITPNIERRTVRLPPGVTISTQLILSVLIGGQGLILATPLVAVGLVLVKELYIEDVLGEPVDDSGETGAKNKTEPENE